MKRANLGLKQLISIAILSIELLFSPNQVLATEALTTGTTCTGLDCGSTITESYAFKQAFSQAIPLNVQLFSSGNECLYITVTSQNIVLGHGVALGLNVKDNYLKKAISLLKA